MTDLLSYGALFIATFLLGLLARWCRRRQEYRAREQRLQMTRKRVAELYDHEVH